MANRIDAEGVRSYMAKGKFLVADDTAGLAGCVYVELRGDRGYLGLLGVDPTRQGTGLGRKLMDAAESCFRDAGSAPRHRPSRYQCTHPPLPAFYRHLGYLETGSAPFAPMSLLRSPATTSSCLKPIR